MENIYIKIRERARQLVKKYPAPAFYDDFSDANGESKHFFDTDQMIVRLREFVSAEIESDFGHGIAHARKVSIDAGALILIESVNKCLPEPEAKRKLFIVQCAGLLHDLKRKEKDHALKGAEFARELLKQYQLSHMEIDEVCQAIRNHEAFKETQGGGKPGECLVSDCLYDADKFRWGPDNFTHTVWDMVMFANIPLSKFIKHYPGGMKTMSKIKLTFRTETGKKYGPQFIDIGISVGERLFKVIHQEFSEYL
ncbi:MAG: HD domain-containing protein [Proteobacteria bacterium]|nr:HD domain-containing protein [Pseudomonadota bacterium]